MLVSSTWCRVEGFTSVAIFWMLGVFPPLVENIKNYVFAIVISGCTMGHGIFLKKGRAIELYIHMDKAMATYGGMET